MLEQLQDKSDVEASSAVPWYAIQPHKPHCWICIVADYSLPSGKMAVGRSAISCTGWWKDSGGMWGVGDTDPDHRMCSRNPQHIVCRCVWIDTPLRSGLLCGSMNHAVYVWKSCIETQDTTVCMRQVCPVTWMLMCFTQPVSEYSRLPCLLTRKCFWCVISAGVNISCGSEKVDCRVVTASL